MSPPGDSPYSPSYGTLDVRSKAPFADTHSDLAGSPHTTLQHDMRCGPCHSLHVENNMINVLFTGDAVQQFDSHMDAVSEGMCTV